QCYGYKWVPSSAAWGNIDIRAAALPDRQRRALESAPAELFRVLGCRDYARFDFRTDAKGEIKLLEVNPNPSWCWDGKMAVMAELAGVSYGQMLRKILGCAWKRR